MRRIGRKPALALAALAALTMSVLPAAAHPEDEKDNRRGAQGVTTDGEPGESHGVRVIGHADPGTGFHGDVFAHQGHAYLGSWASGAARCPSFGVRAFDIGDPANPEHVSTFAHGTEGDGELFGTWTEKVIVQRFKGRDLAAVSVQNCRIEPEIFRGWALYDVTDPANPERLALVPSVARGSHEIWLEPRGNRLYVYTAVIGAELASSPDGETPGPEKDFQIWDVSDPRNPELVGQWGAWEELGIPREFVDENGVRRTSHVHSVIGAVVGNQHRAYLSYWDTGTVILDVSDPADPVFLGRTEFAPHEEGNAHSAWLARGGNILIQADEDFGPAGTDVIEQAWGYARVFDISDPANPVQLTTIEMPTTRQVSPDRPGDFSVHDPVVRGSTLYLSWYAEGVVVFDISDPANPQQQAQFLPPPAEDPFGLFVPAQVNVWGVALDRNLVLASDMSSGLWIFTLDRSAS